MFIPPVSQFLRNTSPFLVAVQPDDAVLVRFGDRGHEWLRVASIVRNANGDHYHVTNDAGQTWILDHDHVFGYRHRGHVMPEATMQDLLRVLFG